MAVALAVTEATEGAVATKAVGVMVTACWRHELPDL